MNYKNTSYCLKQRPYGKVDKNTWAIREDTLTEIQDGEILLENKYISLDPAMRGWMDDRKSYIDPVQVGDVMRAGTLSQVIESRNADFQPGQYIVGWHGVQKYAVSDGRQDFNLGKELAVPAKKYLGVLGMPGYTAYFGLLDIGAPKEGETIVVSAAAGAVGSLVGQIAKIKGMKVVGIAGGAEKCNYLTDTLGFDAAADYKSMEFPKQIVSATSDGVDIYFDNVGGEMLDFMLTRLNLHARVVICGAISQYNNTQAPYGPSNYLSLLVNRARMEGFIVFDYKQRYAEAAVQMAQWLMEGKVKSEEFVIKGLDKFPEAFDRLFTGEKRGKLVLEL